MDKQELYAQVFSNTFRGFIGQRIALYGAGRLTNNLLPRIKGFNIVCIIDKDEKKEGTKICDISVVGIDSIENDIDCIIINTSELYWDEIYESLKILCVPVYYRDGTKADSDFSIGTIIDNYRSLLCTYGGEIVLDLIAARVKETQRGVSAEDWGYCIYGPIIETFFEWLYDETLNDGIQQCLFLARDGYLLAEEYSLYLNQRGDDDSTVVYFPASRRMTCVAAIMDDETFERVSSYSFQGTFHDYMKSRFNIIIKDNKNSDKRIILPDDWGGEVKDWISAYQGMIYKEAKEERNEYLKYIEGLGLKKRLGIVDFGFYGTLPYYLKTLLSEKEIVTYYFNGDLSIENPYCSIGTKVCFQEKKDVYAMKSSFRKYQNQNEAVFTAPYGMMERIVNQSIITQQEREGRNFDINRRIDIGIKDFIRDVNDAEIFVCEEYRIIIDKLFGELNKALNLRHMRELRYVDTWSGL